ncbi:hypothetical protein C8R47DRAFT_517081 [Mycena vitilis]|nr:hypothetical protein C8R47DRAFT_517081 [Mycena vitilis]
MSNSSAASLPDDVLAAILKLVADLPVITSRRTLPAPVAASRVSRRWRVVALGSADLWTNIRLSHHRAWSWSWAAVFVKRSCSYPLDITIDLQAWRCRDAPIPFRRALAIVGPHIGRWRTFALQAPAAQFRELAAFVGRATVAARQLEYCHLSWMDWPLLDRTLHLGKLFGSQSVRAVRIEAWSVPDDIAAFRALRTLDIVFTPEAVSSPAFRQLLGPLSHLTTLIIRRFRDSEWYYHWYMPDKRPIDCSTIKSFVIDFYEHLVRQHRYPGIPPSQGPPAFKPLTDIFSLPNLEHLEILGGFSGSSGENDHIPLPEEWEAPLFPYLRTLRLEDVGLSCRGLALIQSLSQNITVLQLVYTNGENHLLTNPAAWPALRELTVETAAGVVNLEWLAPYVVKRAALGMPLSDITLPPWVKRRNIVSRLMVLADVAPIIHWQRPGPSPALMDGLCGQGFYIDKYDMRAVNFDHVPWAKEPIPYHDSEWYDVFAERAEERIAVESELLEEEIEWDLKMRGDVPRSNGMRRKLARKRRRRSKIGSRTAAKEVRGGPRSWRYNYMAEEYSVA